MIVQDVEQQRVEVDFEYSLAWRGPPKHGAFSDQAREASRVKGDNHFPISRVKIHIFPSSRINPASARHLISIEWLH